MQQVASQSHNVEDVQTKNSHKQCNRVLYLFSGKSREGSLRYWLSKLGIEVDEYDIEATPSHDLSEDLEWQEIFKRIRSGYYALVFCSPPCGTFSSARRWDGGPQPLRGAEGKSRYGYPSLKGDDREKVKLHNWFSIMTAQLGVLCHTYGVGFGIENPARRQHKPSLFGLDELLEMKTVTGAIFNKFPQCKFGSVFQKYTEILATFELAEFNSECKCTHRWWTIPWSGENSFGPHPPLKGRQIAVPSETWDESMLSSEPSGPFLTRATAHYSSQMNKRLAVAIATHISGVRRVFETTFHSAKRPMIDTCPVELPSVTKRAKITGEEQLPREVKRSLEEEDVVGGLRNAFKSVKRSCKAYNLGVIIRNTLDAKLNESPQVQEQILSSVGKPLGTSRPPVEWVNDLRVHLSKSIARFSNLSLISGSWDDFNKSVNNENCNTCLKHNFWKLWAQAIEDPALHVVDWLENGAPAGLLVHPDLKHIFPETDDHGTIFTPDVLFTEFSQFSNYQGVEENPAAAEAIQGYIDKGYLHVCDTLDQCRQFLGGQDPILSKLGCIVKNKLTPEGSVVSKTRIILDAKESNVTSATLRRFRSILPRVTDAVSDALHLASQCKKGECVEQLIADVSDAFWLVPLEPRERRFFVAKFRGKFLVFLRTAQGSRTAPLTFCTIMSLATRLVQSVLMLNHDRTGYGEGARVQVYTDDPWVVTKGTPEQIDRCFAIVLLLWDLLGLPIATHKATRGPSLKWIGMQITVNQREVQVEIPEDKILELESLSLDILASNVTSCKVLRSYVGKAMYIASTIYTWRPFLSQLFAALFPAQGTNAPKGCVWTKQIVMPIKWILAFLHSLHSHRVRTWNVENYRRTGPRVTIIWDASPVGFGGILLIDDKIIEYFADVPQSFEIELLQLQIGNSESQQILESLAGLVALRLWSKHWQQTRVELAIRSDNIGALVLFSRMKTSSVRNSIVAREFALDLGNASFSPDVVQHIPGFTNTICDSLSRLPLDGYSVPGCLKGVPRAKVIIRDQQWWKSLTPPQIRRPL